MTNSSNCVNCFILDVSKTKELKKKHIEDILDQYDVDDLKPKSPAKKNLSLEITHKISQKNTWILYWASKYSEDILLPSVEDAYDKSKNSGVVKTDKNGNFTMKLNCPTVYHLDKKVTNPRHVHFVVLKKKSWDTDNIHTIHFLYDLNFDTMNDWVGGDAHMIVNAIDIEGSKYKENIPNSHYLKMPKTGTKKVKTDVVNKFIDEHIDKYPPLKKAFSDKKSNKFDVPMVIYCAHTKCDASKKLCDTLMSLGFNNIYDFSAGIEGWFAKAKKDNNPDNSSNNVDNRLVDFEGIKYTVTPDNKVLDDDFKIIGRYKDDKISFSKSEYKKKHKKMKKEINKLFDSDSDIDSDNEDDDDDSDSDDDDDDDDSDFDDDDDDDDDDSDSDDDDDDEFDEDNLSLSKEEIDEIHSMTKSQLRKELKKIRNQLKSGGDDHETLMTTCGNF